MGDPIVGTGGLLRFGHARGLTPHRGVIQDLRAASLPRLSAKTNDLKSTKWVSYHSKYTTKSKFKLLRNNALERIFEGVVF